MEDERIGDLKFRVRPDGRVSVRWLSEHSEPPRRTPFPDEEWVPGGIRFLAGTAVLTLLLAVVAVVSGVRLVRVGDLLWGVLALLPGLLLGVVSVVTAVSVAGIHAFRQGDVIHLDGLAGARFAADATELRRQLGSETADQEAAAARLWELAWQLDQDSSPA